MKNHEVRQQILHKIENLESELNRMSKSNDRYFMLQIAVSNLYIALSNTKG